MKSTLFILLLFLGANLSAQVSKSGGRFLPDPLNGTPENSAMVLVKGGPFKMGNAQGKKNAKPVHAVTLKDYYIGKYEVTQELWRAVMHSDSGSKSDCNDCPVYDVTIESVQRFLTNLNQVTGRKYRLPTEAEWEYAAAGGESSKGYKYCGSNNVDEVAWYAPNAEQKTHRVGLKKPNELGLYDMSGNVWELCSDWYHAGYYRHSQADAPNNQKKGMFKVVRGGSWRSEEERCQAHARNRNIHDHRIGNCGFRLVLEK